MRDKTEMHNTTADTLCLVEENIHESDKEIANREAVLNDNLQRKNQIPDNDPMYFWNRVKQNKAKFDW